LQDVELQELKHGLTRFYAEKAIKKPMQFGMKKVKRRRYETMLNEKF